MKRGRFITLEGGEGAGKSTNARYIKSWLEQRGRQVVLTREPGGSALAEAIREIVLRPWSEGMPAVSETLLMFAARAAHLRSTIEPALAAGKDVVCDRFTDSSFAYQGAGNHFPEDQLQALERMVLGDFRPDLVIVFDLDPRLGLERAHQRGEKNRFEEESLAFLQRVREAFLSRAQSRPDRYSIVDAGCDLPAVQGELSRVLEERL